MHDVRGCLGESVDRVLGSAVPLEVWAKDLDPLNHQHWGTVFEGEADVRLFGLWGWLALTDEQQLRLIGGALKVAGLEVVLHCFSDLLEEVLLLAV